MSRRKSPMWWMSREALMERARNERQSHLKTAELMQRAVMTERSDTALPALATWDDVRMEQQSAKIYKYVLLHLRTFDFGTPITGEQWAHIKELARVRACAPGWRVFEARRVVVVVP